MTNLLHTTTKNTREYALWDISKLYPLTRMVSLLLTLNLTKDTPYLLWGISYNYIS